MNRPSKKKCVLYVSKSDSILDEKIESIKQSLKDRINLETDFKVFYGNDDIDEAELINYLSMPSFFSDIKVAVIRDIDDAPASALKKFAKFLYADKDEDKGYSVIMTATDERIPKDIRESIKANCSILRLNEPSSDNLGRWLEEKAELDGIGFTSKAKNVLISSVGNDLGMLKREYEKLLTFTIDDKSKKIDDDTVRNLVVKKYTAKIYDLIDHIGSRDKKKAFSALRPVLDEKQSLIGFIVLVHRMFKTILYLKADRSGKKAESFMDANIKVSPYFKKKLLSKYRRYSKNYSMGELIEIFRLLNRCDIDLRSSVVEPGKVIERLIFEIIDLDMA